MPTVITTINSGDHPSDSRSVINNNFDSLNTNKLEKSNNLSDVTVKATAAANLLPDQSGNANKLLKTDGAGALSWTDATSVPDASTTTKGIIKTSVAPAVATSPIAVGDNDGRVPTQDENDALAGQSGTAPSASNKFLDNAYGAQTVAKLDTTTTLGTDDTKYPSQKAVKTYVDNGDVALYKSIASDTLRYSLDTERTTTSASAVLSKKILLQSTPGGVIRVKFDIKDSTTTSARAQIYKNGVAFGTDQSNATASYVTISEDLVFAPGDTVELWKRADSGTTCYVRNFRIYYDIQAGDGSSTITDV